jgi:hypothetical protein
MRRSIVPSKKEKESLFFLKTHSNAMRNGAKARRLLLIDPPFIFIEGGIGKRRRAAV